MKNLDFVPSRLLKSLAWDNNQGYELIFTFSKLGGTSSWGVEIKLGVESRQELWSLAALDMAKLTKIAYFGSLRGTIDSENLLLLEKTAKKPSTRTKHAVKLFCGD